MSIIFDSFANVAKVTEELEHLKQTARELLGSRTGVTLSSFAWNRHSQFAGSGEWVCQWASVGADLSESGLIGPTVIGKVLLCIDLYRDRRPDVPRRKLDHAEAALITCAFIAGQDIREEDTYLVEYLKFDACGWPIRSETFARHAGGRLLEYQEKHEEGRRWAERSWLFTVPFEALPNPRAFRTQISDPFWAIVQHGPEVAFLPDSAACIFPNDGTAP